MTRILPFFLFAFISTFLLSCAESTENRRETKETETILTEKNDSISDVKTDSMSDLNKETAGKTTTTEKPDSADFSRVLTFKNIAFSVKAKGKGSLQQVTVQPSGLSSTNRTETMETEPVVNAEIGDLNADGYPELLIFTQSAGSGSYGKVIAFSVNNGKSMSRVTFPEISENASLKKGYGGHDKFAVVNNSLTQEFRIYNEGDANSKPTGLKRVITYKLKNGDASRIFVVDQVKEVEGK